MENINFNNFVVSDFVKVIEDKELKFLFFKNEFNYEMARTSCDTLININLIVDEYLVSYHKEAGDGEKLTLLFGLLQGLFVAIDALYTIGKMTNLNKLMININQNNNLREIKHIRNDVVGHPTFRFYEDTVGFCTLDFRNINASIFKYFIYTIENGKTKIEEKNVDLLDVIDSYYLESNAILSQTLEFFKLKQKPKKINISLLVSLLGLRFTEGNIDLELLDKIHTEYVDLFHLAKNVNNRVLWRINLIKLLYSLPQDEYYNYLTITEIFKLYSLLYNLERQITKGLKFKFTKFNKNNEFHKLRLKIKKIKSKDFDINNLHDSRHPLYNGYMNIIFEKFSKDKEVSNLIKWIKDRVHEENNDILYLIGSELKK